MIVVEKFSARCARKSAGPWTPPSAARSSPTSRSAHPAGTRRSRSEAPSPSCIAFSGARSRSTSSDRCARRWASLDRALARQRGRSVAASDALTWESRGGRGRRANQPPMGAGCPPRNHRQHGRANSFLAHQMRSCFGLSLRRPEPAVAVPRTLARTGEPADGSRSPAHRRLDADGLGSTRGTRGF